MIEEYKPKIIYDNNSHIYGEILIELNRCPICKKIMIYQPRHWRYEDIYPKYNKITLDEQIKKAGWIFESDAHLDGVEEYICEECKEKGLATFKCVLCGERKTFDKEKESFGGYPPDYLCIDCFKSVSAEIWDKKTDELHELHRYDFD